MALPRNQLHLEPFKKALGCYQDEMLELGLQRISRLVDASKLPWRAVHVAGTNGKGSVCAYIYAMLNRAKVSTGMFTSPHLIDRWDGISLNGNIIKRDYFLDIERQVKLRDKRLKLDATEFELLTATAFEAFNRAKIEIGVVEVGVGGKLDATNILRNPLATVITHLSLDHRGLLGDTVEEIAAQKAGILKPGVPCFVDGRSPVAAKKAIAARAEEVGSGPLKFLDNVDKMYPRLMKRAQGENLAPFQRMNLALAFEAGSVALESTGRANVEALKAADALRNVSVPGRKQKISIARVTGSQTEILLDGAHNPQAAAALKQHLESNPFRKMPPRDGRITWILAFTDSKDIKRMLSMLLSRKDDVIAVEFGPVAGMPWVKSLAAERLVELAKESRNLTQTHAVSTVEEALHLAQEIHQANRIVVAGSLYLVSDILRLLRSKGTSEEELGLTT